MKTLGRLVALIVCVSFCRIHSVVADGLDDGAESLRAQLIASYPWLASCTASSTGPCLVPPGADVDTIQTRLLQAGQGSSFNWCDIFPFLPWCRKKASTTTTTTQRSTPTHMLSKEVNDTSSTITTVQSTTSTLPTTSEQVMDTTTKSFNTTTGTKPTTVTTPHGGNFTVSTSSMHTKAVTTDSSKKITTTATTVHPVTSAHSNVTLLPHNTTTESPRNHTTSSHKPKTTTTQVITSTANTSGDADKFNIKWFFVGFATMFGVALVIVLIVVLCVRYRRAGPGQGYSVLGSA